MHARYVYLSSEPKQNNNKIQSHHLVILYILIHLPLKDFIYNELKTLRDDKMYDYYHYMNILFNDYLTFFKFQKNNQKINKSII